MREITHEDYKSFRKSHNSVLIEEVSVELRGPWHPKKLEPEDFQPETTTVWSFPDRGDWATHVGNYRGNWSPFIPRNLMLRYTQKGDLVLDQMMGSGTTLVECKLLGRRAIGVDINPDAVMVARDRLNFTYSPPLSSKRWQQAQLAAQEEEGEYEPEIKTYVGDSRSLDLIADNSIDLIATHPPYASIIPYSRQRVEGDLSSVHDIAEFSEEMKKVAEEAHRVLKPGKHCAILIGDTRRHKHFVPITPRVLEAFLEAGFILREDIIKQQWKMKSTREKWRGKDYDFLLIAHEHLYVFRKLAEDERPTPYKESMRWW